LKIITEMIEKLQWFSVAKLNKIETIDNFDAQIESRTKLIENMVQRIDYSNKSLELLRLFRLKLLSSCLINSTRL
jgi:hypothetical protein